MRYTGPKMKLCRREGVNLFGSAKYDLAKRDSLPGQHGGNRARLSEYGKLLRNKQKLKRIYGISEKNLVTLVRKTAQKFSKNKGIDHDKALIQFLERRADVLIYKAGLANTIMQARQMVVHGHFLLNDHKHTVPSTYLKPGDTLTLKKKLQNSPLYSAVDGNVTVPSWIKVDKKNFGVELLDLPNAEQVTNPVDVLKVIEFYARA